MKLSLAQERVLRIMVIKDSTVCVLSGREGAHAFFMSPKVDNTRNKVRPKTIWALESKGLIYCITDPKMRWQSREWQATEKGCAAIQEAD